MHKTATSVSALRKTTVLDIYYNWNNFDLNGRDKPGLMGIHVFLRFNRPVKSIC